MFTPQALVPGGKAEECLAWDRIKSPNLILVKKEEIQGYHTLRGSRAGGAEPQGLKRSKSLRCERKGSPVALTILVRNSPWADHPPPQMVRKQTQDPGDHLFAAEGKPQ